LNHWERIPNIDAKDYQRHWLMKASIASLKKESKNSMWVVTKTFIRP